ncbi:ribosome modulation factor [Methylobacterium sp.]|uniref:ribosome modulation factor n=1 Tax=Methylobacterium sp. TaxID=409 RepID=UPI003AFF7C6D
MPAARCGGSRDRARAPRRSRPQSYDDPGLVVPELPLRGVGRIHDREDCIVMLSSRSPTAISDEGRHARDRGEPLSANPYPEGSNEHRTWARGYRTPDHEASDPASDRQTEDGGRTRSS